MLNKYKSLLKGSESDLSMAAEGGGSKSMSGAPGIPLWLS